MTPFYEKLQKCIVQQNAHAHQQRITEQLYPAPQVAVRKHNVFAHGKAHREADGKRNQKGGDVAANAQPGYMHDRLRQPEIKSQKVNQCIYRRVKPATGQITKVVYTYPARKRTVEKVYD